MKVVGNLFNNMLTKSQHFFMLVCGKEPVNRKNAMNSWRAMMRRQSLVVMMMMVAVKTSTPPRRCHNSTQPQHATASTACSNSLWAWVHAACCCATHIRITMSNASS